MVEIAAVGIHPVMTRQAVLPKSEDMLHHELHILLGVTIPARFSVHHGHICAVTVFALERCHQRLEAVPLQGEVRRFMREHQAVQHGQQRIRPVVLRMTIAAQSLWLQLHDPAVYGIDRFQFLANIRMAVQTAVLHGVWFPGGRMAGLAVLRQIGMRRDPAQRRPCGGVQLTGAVHGAAAGECRCRNNDQRDQTGHDPGAGETTKAYISHLLFSFHDHPSRRNEKCTLPRESRPGLAALPKNSSLLHPVMRHHSGKAKKI